MRSICYLRKEDKDIYDSPVPSGNESGLLVEEAATRVSFLSELQQCNCTVLMWP